MTSQTPTKSNLTALLASTSGGNATLVRCPTDMLQRLRNLHEAEWITLFTPVVPHPPSTALERNMDPFEPLGRALARQVRHVPYRLDYGMTETHVDFIPSAGAILIVICTTENIMSHNSRAFEQQRKFARDIQKKVEDKSGRSITPMILLLCTNGANKQTHQDGLSEFPALLTCTDYNTLALSNAVRVLFDN
ncbi:hypothetical protein BU24DRAFT_433570 [Aaosphaeria arxii CBS 175.79]|uniref:Uncharacterized protein n=1 Tax=Aaosphaeria arxii CBS 175.79 TaxID=1450172 RepID=A0A6A5XVJ6_9PLEO|nr:uncharacterized protein BU24DRAFT_433570 [Aaosphaeria arxii CBS 175.79]KAF2016731.1 hypothetical protein BU24DRAFT_433570 [Aaosphaeria arxii CBS 175.79]